MSSTRSHRFLRTRTIVSCFLMLLVVGIYVLYEAHVKTVEYVKSQHSKCLNEQDTLYGNLREESLAKFKAELDLKSGKKVLTELKEIHMKEKDAMKAQIDVMQVELETLKLECSKYEKQAREEHAELEKNKVSLSESQKQLNSQLVLKNNMIDLLKQDKKKLKDIIKKIKGNKSFPFNYPPKKIETKNFGKQIEIGKDEFKVIIGDENKVYRPFNNNQLEPIAQNLNKLANILTPKSSTTSMSVKRKSGNVIPLNDSVHSEIRPIVPHGFAPELIVNDEKHKNGDYVGKADISNEGKNKQDIVENKNNEEVKPPNRYKAKLDKSDLKFEDNKVEEAVKFPIKVGYQEDKHGMFHFGEDHNAFDANNQLDDNSVNDGNISLDQAEPGLQAEEDDDDYDEFDKANFHHQAENMN